MDTVEELNGTYFYRGFSNLSAGELLFWVFLDETAEQLGTGGLIYRRADTFWPAQHTHRRETGKVDAGYTTPKFSATPLVEY